ncbi:MAG: iron-containing alcohol dehydrogenase [Treponema sp.]|nr:iron-containing alcohol dehydrogenase [Treponema sp.]
MSDFIFKIPQNIILGSYTATRIGEYIKPWGSKFMLILDPTLRQVSTIDKIVQPLAERKVDFFTFDDLPERPESKVIENALKLARQAHISGLIAVGGSKAISIGRAVAALFNSKKDIYTHIEEKNISEEPLPLICVPTTNRDTFVFTDMIPVVDSRSSTINLLKVQKTAGKIILIDPNLTQTLSDHQMTSMNMEIIAIALESYLSQKATFFSDMMAEKSFELIKYAINGSASLEVTTPQEILLSQSGCMASLASTTSSLGVCSLLALCMNARYKISRSLTASVLLPHIIDDATKFRQDKLAKAARLLGATEAADNATKAAEDFAEFIRNQLAIANLPTRLKDLGVTIEQMSLAAEDAGSLELINSLPRSMTTDDLFSIIKLAY